MHRHFLLCALALAVFPSADLRAQVSLAEQVQIVAPVRHAEPPSPGASVAELEARGDQLRVEKAYLDALDYYRAALAKKPDNSQLYNKTGITLLLMQRFRDARKDFERAIKNDRQYADAYNNLGVVYYEERNYGKAIKQYLRGIELRADAASYHSNLGAAYFSRREFEKAAISYAQALQLDPDVLERTSRAGVTAQLPSPEDRARYDYVVAKLYAKIGVADRSLEHLRRAVEEGYKDINNVYKDIEFAELRKDPRFTELMAARPVAIPQ
jgi:tetratricopeptide (TPR) repeat protein